MKVVFNPLPDIARHIVKVEGVRGELTDRRDFSELIVTIGNVTSISLFSKGDVAPLNVENERQALLALSR